jgi:hypothetical protein
MSDDSSFPRFVAAHAEEEELNALIPLITEQKDKPLGRLALRIVAASLTQPGTCMICECTEDDCRECIERTGLPCSWVNENRTLCSACV